MTDATLLFAAPRDAHLEREAICRHDEVTPPAGGAKGVLDASRLSFPLMLVLIIGSTTAGIVGTYSALSARIDVQNQQITALKEQKDALQRQVALDAVRIDETRVIVAEIKGFMTATGMKEVKK